MRLQTRNVDLSQKLGELPASLEPLHNKISLVPEIASAEEPTLPFDQLTVSMHFALADQLLSMFYIV